MELHMDWEQLPSEKHFASDAESEISGATRDLQHV